MAKYSTGSDTDRPRECELCGERASTLTRATVAGAKLHVCPSCEDHDDTTGRDTDASSGETSRNSQSASHTRQASRNTGATTGSTTSVGSGDSTRWETEGTNYDDDQLPYLVIKYDDRAREAREAAGIEIEDLAADLDASEADVRAVEEGRASRADVGGSVVRAIEERLDVTLVE